MSSRRVVVTGMGIIAPVGNDVETAWSQVVSGRSGIGPITDFDASQFSTTIGGSIRNFDAGQYIPPKEQKKMGPFIHFGIASARPPCRRTITRPMDSPTSRQVPALRL